MLYLVQWLCRNSGERDSDDDDDAGVGAIPRNFKKTVSACLSALIGAR